MRTLDEEVTNPSRPVYQVNIDGLRARVDALLLERAQADAVLKLIWEATEANAEAALKDAHRRIARLKGWKR